MNMRIRKAEFKDARELAEIHVKFLPESFLCTLGEKFLALLYKAMIGSENGIVIIVEDDERVAGFISGTTDMRKLNAFFRRKNFFKAFFLLFPRMFRPSVCRKIIEDVFYSIRKPAASLPDAELLSIAVKKDYRGKGVGAKLFAALVCEMREKKINNFKILVGENLKDAQKFYERMGCEAAGKEELHKGEVSKVYIFKVRQ